MEEKILNELKNINLQIQEIDSKIDAKLKAQKEEICSELRQEFEEKLDSKLESLKALMIQILATWNLITKHLVYPGAFFAFKKPILSV